MKNRRPSDDAASRRHIPTAFSLRERERQAAWKRGTPDLTQGAREPGRFGEATGVKFILPIAHADENLWSAIRAEVVAYFDHHAIAWHDGENEAYGTRRSPGPSPHLLDSQVAAMNFWWGLARSPTALAFVLRGAFPDLRRLVTPSGQAQLIAPEWIGEENYLGEYTAPGTTRTRGRYATSSDALLIYECDRGLRHAVMLESKYTESYLGSTMLPNRAPTYRDAFEAADGSFAVANGVAIEPLLVEPFYQLMRQQLLATAMERAREQGVTTVTVLHVAPQANRAFHEGITSTALRARGSRVLDVWRSLLSNHARFASLSYESAFARAGEARALVGAKEGEHLDGWLEYQRSRYCWEALPS